MGRPCVVVDDVRVRTAMMRTPDGQGGSQHWVGKRTGRTRWAYVASYLSIARASVKQLGIALAVPAPRLLVAATESRHRDRSSRGNAGGDGHGLSLGPDRVPAFQPRRFSEWWLSFVSLLD